MFNQFSSETRAYQSLGGNDFKAEYLKSNKPVLIDVRTAEEYASGSITNARNIDIFSHDFQEQITALDKGSEYFLFCRSGGRSEQACMVMAEHGFKVYNLRGGVGAWPR